MAFHINSARASSIGVTQVNPLFTFSAISDIHLHDNNDDCGYDDLVKLFHVLGNRIKWRNLNLKYIFCAGDIGMNGHSASPDSTHEIETFNAIVQQKCPIGKDKVFSCNGNHDQEYTTEEWKQSVFDASLYDIVTEDKNVSFNDGNFTFAFMSLAHQADRSTTVNGRICYLDDAQTQTRQWLQNVVQQSSGKTLVLFMHYPLPNRKCVDTSTTNIDEYDWVTGDYVPKSVKICQTEGQYAGLLDAGGSADNNLGQTIYGFYLKAGTQDYSTKTESEEILDILKQHVGKVVVFSGHTHLVFETEDMEIVVGKGYSNVNVANIPGTNITTVHIPSLNHPRKLKVSTIGEVSGWQTISGSNPYRQPCQSWLVDVFNDKLVLRGFESNVCHDKRYGDILTKYVYPIYI